MKVYILSRKSSLYSTKRLYESAKDRGWDVRVLDYLKFSIEIEKGELMINYNGELLEAPDAIIPRIGASRTFYGTAMVRHLEMMNAFSVAGSLAISRSRDKLRSLQILSKYGVDMPKTVFASNKSDVNDIIKLSGGTPLVLKILEGTQGVGVVLVETQKAAKSVLDAFYGMDVNYLATYMSWFSTDPKSNLASFQRTQTQIDFDKEVVKIVDPADQEAATEEIMRHLYEEARFTPLWWTPATAVSQPYVHHEIYRHGFIRVDWENVWMDEH